MSIYQPGLAQNALQPLLEVDLEFLPTGGLVCPSRGSLQPHADMETQPPKEEDHRWEKHNVEDEVLVQFGSKKFGAI